MGSKPPRISGFSATQQARKSKLAQPKEGASSKKKGINKSKSTIIRDVKVREHIARREGALIIGDEKNLPMKAQWGDFLATSRERTIVVSEHLNDELDHDDKPMIKQPLRLDNRREQIAK